VDFGGGGPGVMVTRRESGSMLSTITASNGRPFDAIRNNSIAGQSNGI